MVELSILTDHLAEIEAHPDEFVTRVREAMSRAPGEGRDISVGRAAACATVQRAHHGSEPKFYVSERGWFISMSEYDLEDLLIEIGRSDDRILDLLDEKLEAAIGALRKSRRYLKYIRELKEDQRPGSLHHDKLQNNHHREAARRHKRLSSS